MTRIAFLGQGAMGTRMARRLLEAGHRVTVWNRTPERTGVLAGAGAAVAGTPREAAKGARVVLSMVRDDEASRFVWLDDSAGALGGMAGDAIGVECSTVSLSQVETLAGAFADRGRALIDAPVAGSRPQAEAGQLIFLAGGSEETLATVRPVLECLGNAAHHAGPAGAGMAMKLMVNALFGVQLAAVAELLGFIRAAGLPPERAVEILRATPVCSPAAGAAAGAMAAGHYAPAFPIDLVAKDFGLIGSSAGRLAARLPVAEAAAGVYRAGIVAGLGSGNITGIARLYPATA